MSLIEAVVMGLVQGLTEFLPVSSSGHLVLFRNIFGITGSPILFEVMVHLGTLVAVWRRVLQGHLVYDHPPHQQADHLSDCGHHTGGVVTLFFSDFIESAFGGSYLGFGFLLTAVFLLVAWKFGAQRGGRRFRGYGGKGLPGHGPDAGPSPFCRAFPGAVPPLPAACCPGWIGKSPCDLDF